MSLHLHEGLEQPCARLSLISVPTIASVKTRFAWHDTTIITRNMCEDISDSALLRYLVCSCSQAGSSSALTSESDRFLQDEALASTALTTSGKYCQVRTSSDSIGSGLLHRPHKALPGAFDNKLVAVAPNMDSDVLRTASPTPELCQRVTKVAEQNHFDNKMQLMEHAQIRTTQHVFDVCLSCAQSFQHAHICLTLGQIKKFKSKCALGHHLHADLGERHPIDCISASISACVSAPVECLTVCRSQAVQMNGTTTKDSMSNLSFLAASAMCPDDGNIDTAICVCRSRLVWSRRHENYAPRTRIDLHMSTQLGGRHGFALVSWLLHDAQK